MAILCHYDERHVTVSQLAKLDRRRKFDHRSKTGPHL